MKSQTTTWDVKSLVNTGITYQPELVFSPVFWSINSIFQSPGSCLKFTFITCKLAYGIRSLVYDPGIWDVPRTSIFQRVLFETQRTVYRYPLSSIQRPLEDPGMYIYIYKQIVDESWCFISTFLRNEPSAHPCRSVRSFLPHLCTTSTANCPAKAWERPPVSTTGHLTSFRGDFWWISHELI